MFSASNVGLFFMEDILERIERDWAFRAFPFVLSFDETPRRHSIKNVQYCKCDDFVFFCCLWNFSYVS